MKCLLVTKNEHNEAIRSLTELSRDELPPGDVLIRVRYSSLNYKDALAAQGHPGVAARLPHIPGIDAAGVVEESTSASVSVGDEVLVTGYDQGAGQWGGWSEYVRVPGDWVVPLPPGISLLDAMTLGTAGFTAAQCVQSLRHHEITPESGPVVVTGATGGVGSIAVMLLAQLGYQATAISGKQERYDWLRKLGASEILGRDAVDDTSGKPMLPARWQGAVDTVGGNTLATLIKSLMYRGCVAACGLVAGAELALTVYPFLLRGVTLDGIDSAQCPRAKRERIWELLSGDWQLPQLETIRTVISFAQLEDHIAQILAGKIAGRVVLDIDA